MQRYQQTLNETRVVAKAAGRKRIGRALGVALVAALAGCSAERSRNLDNPQVSANTIALQVCSNCHGAKGVAESPGFPNLAGQVPDYLEAQLKSFKHHERATPAGATYMWGLSSHLTDAQISGLAAYFAAQPPATGKLKDAQLFEQGRQIYNAGIAANGTPACAACHGPKGEGMATFPRLAGQHADYTLKQLMVYQSTDARPSGAIMKGIAHGLTRQNMESLAVYLQAVPQG
jgi:cytochrome c553